MTFRFHQIDSYMYTVIKLTFTYQVFCLNVYENLKPELSKEGIVVYMKQRCKNTGTVWILRPQTEEKILVFFYRIPHVLKAPVMLHLFCMISYTCLKMKFWHTEIWREFFVYKNVSIFKMSWAWSPLLPQWTIHWDLVMTYGVIMAIGQHYFS